MVKEKIYLKELQCYIEATQEMKNHKLLCNSNRYFDLRKLPTLGLQKEMCEFIEHRGRELTVLSLRGEIYPYSQLCMFLTDEYPDMHTFHQADVETMERQYQKWLLKNGKNLCSCRRRTDSEKVKMVKAEGVTYLRKVIDYFNPSGGKFDFEEDIWKLEYIPKSVRRNPVKTVKSISFNKIPQITMRTELKQIIYAELSHKALGTIMCEITAANRFAQFLSKSFPQIKSLKEIDREIICEYLIYLNTVANERKSFTKDISHLKSIFATGGFLLELDDWDMLFYRDDIGKSSCGMFKVYSDEEIVRLNDAIIEGDEQVARVLILHQLLGTRISETLTLRKDCIYTDAQGHEMITIQQIKPGRMYEKPINDDIKKLIQAAIRYTKAHYGDREYVFVSQKNPDNPMQYSQIGYWLRKLIIENDLQDDYGERFGAGTHIFRHCYGKRLTELHVDDLVLAKLLGHANTSSLIYYRKVGNQMMADETREVRVEMDEQMRKYLRGWQDGEV